MDIIAKDVKKKPGRKRKKKLTLKQKAYVDNYVVTGNKRKAMQKSGYGKGANPERYQAVQEALKERRKQMEVKFMDDAEEMHQNMLDLARNSKNESVRFQATKDILDRAGLNPISKNQTEAAKYISIESRVSRSALDRYEKEIDSKNENVKPAQKEPRE